MKDTAHSSEQAFPWTYEHLNLSTSASRWTLSKCLGDFRLILGSSEKRKQCISPSVIFFSCVERTRLRHCIYVMRFDLLDALRILLYLSDCFIRYP